jgi:hypothetical protein
MLQPKSPSEFSDAIKISLGGLVFAGICLAGAACVYPMIGKQQKEPVEITAAEIGKVNRPEELPARWVAFTFEKSVPTRFATIEAVSNRVEHVYLMVEVGDRWLLAAVPNKFEGNRLAGVLKTIPAFEFDDMYTATMDTHKGQLMPFQFDAVPNPGGDIKHAFYGLLGASAVCGLFGLMGVFYSIKSYYCEPKVKPVGESVFDANEPIEVDTAAFAKLCR